MVPSNLRPVIAFYKLFVARIRRAYRRMANMHVTIFISSLNRPDNRTNPIGNIRSWTHASMRSLWPCSDSSRTPSFPSQLELKIGLPRANPRGSLKFLSFSRIPMQLEKNDVVPTSSQDEALARYSVSREVPCSVLKWETVLGSLDATPKVP